MIRRWNRSFGLVAFTVILAGCAQPVAETTFAAQRSLVEIVAEVESARDADLYRFDPPRDVTGDDLFRASLARLERFEALLPDPAFRPAMLFARATAEERLLDFASAAANYREVARGKEPLAERAAAQVAFASRLAELCEPLADGMAPHDFIVAVDARRAELASERERFAGDPRACLIDRVIERLDVRRREYLWRMRAVLPDGTGRAISAAEDVARVHAESRRLLEHLLRLGDAFAELARAQFAAVDPHDRDFDADRARNLVRAAAEVYAQVAAVDGRVEREEARAALAALEALGRRIAMPEPER